MKLLLIGVFGVLGIYARYSIDLLINNDRYSFPVSTLTANLIGCFLAGIIYCFIFNKTQSNFLPPLLIGFCGGLTTFSSFSLQALNMMTAEQTMKSLGYLILSPTLGVVFVLLGFQSTLHLFFPQN